MNEPEKGNGRSAPTLQPGIDVSPFARINMPIVQKAAPGRNENRDLRTLIDLGFSPETAEDMLAGGNPLRHRSELEKLHYSAVVGRAIALALRARRGAAT
jgi:hypothetical protein